MPASRVPRRRSSCSSASYESQRGRVHAVTQTCWFRAVIKQMPKVSIAFGAGDSRANDSESPVPNFSDILGCDWRPETGPSGAGIKLCCGVEQGVIAADTPIRSALVQIPVLTGKGYFGVGTSGDVVGIGGKLPAPFVGRCHHLRSTYFFHPCAGVREQHDTYFLRACR